MANNKIDNGPLSSGGEFQERLLDNVSSQGAGIFSTKPTAKYSSGARCVLRVNGRLIGFAFGISWRINTTGQEIMTIDDYLPAEIVPTRVAVEGTISALHVPGQGPSAEFMQANIGSFLFHKYIQIEVRDSATNALLFFTSKAMITSRVEEVKVEQLSTMTLSFKAIGWKDEREPSFPINHDQNDSAKKSGAIALPSNGVVFDAINRGFGGSSVV
jgi:hypothetical protein